MKFLTLHFGDDEGQKKRTEAEEICANPGVSSFIFACSAMLLNGEFSALAKEGKWGTAIGFLVIAYFANIFFYASVASALDVFFLQKVKGKEIAGRKKRILAELMCVLFSAIVYLVVYYVFNGRWVWE